MSQTNQTNRKTPRPTKNNIEYWEKRYAELEDMRMEKDEAYLKTMEKEFKQASRSIDSRLSRFYNQFANEEDISYQEAKKLLNSEELEEFHMTLDEYIRMMDEYEETRNSELKKKLRRASLKYRTTRLEAIGLSLAFEASRAYFEADASLYSYLRDIYVDRYYRSVFTIFKGFGIGTSLSMLNNKTLDKLLHKPWAEDGSNFSSRIWFNKTRLINNLTTTLTQSLILGESYSVASERMQKLMHSEYFKCARIVTTESAYFSSIAHKNSFNDLEVEQYQIVSTLDLKTSKICRDMDGIIFKMSEYKIGETAPPFHPQCRTVTAPYFDDTDIPGYIPAGRSARDSKTGRSYVVPGDMTYHEWYKKYVEDDENT